MDPMHDTDPPLPPNPAPDPPSAMEHMTNNMNTLMTMMQMLLANNALHATAPPSRNPFLPSGVKPPNPERFSANLSARRDVPAWLAATKSALTIAGHDLNSPQTIAFVSVYLDGRARDWWELCKSTTLHNNPNLPPLLLESAGFSSWEAFATAFQKQLGEDRPEERAMERLVQLQQTSSVLKYGEKFSQLLKSLPTLDFQSCRFFYLQGLKLNIRQLMAGRYEDFTPWPALHDLAMQCDAVRGSLPPSNYFVPRHSTSHPTPMDIGTVSASRSPSTSRHTSPARLPRSSTPARHPRSFTPARQHPPPLTAQERAQLQAEGKCFRCRQPGHRKGDPRCIYSSTATATAKHYSYRTGRSPARSESSEKN